MVVVPRESAHFARIVAPLVDQVFSAGMIADRERGGSELARSQGFPAGLLIEFRTALGWPGRSVGWTGFDAVLRYRDAAVARADLVAAAGADAGVGWELTPDGFRATAAGQAFLAALLAHQGVTLRAYWPAGPVSVALPLLARVLGAAEETGGAAFATMAPPYEPPTAEPAVLLLNRLGTLRYHRADAHAAAWGAAGLTAAEIVAMPAGPERDAIEAETNRRAAPPFAVLTPDELDELAAALTALPS